MDSNQDEPVEKIEPSEDIYKRIVVPRKSFTKENAFKFKAVLDDNIEKRNQAFLACDKVGLKVTTLHQRINEALLFLIERADTDFPESKFRCVDYLSYRMRIKFRMVMNGDKEGILFDWTSINRTKPRKASNQISTTVTENLGNAPQEVLKVTDWKTRVIEFITSDDEDEQVLSIDTPEEFGGYYLTDLDIEWLDKTLTAAGMEYKLGPQLIRAIKP